MAESAVSISGSSQSYDSSLISYSTPSLTTTLIADLDEESKIHSAESTKHAVRDEVHEDDIIIAVMGPTGSGKSSFIQIATGDIRVTIGHELKSCTSEIQTIRCRHPTKARRHIVFVDTPGFDDTCISDTDILRELAAWLTSTFRRKIMLSGILYFHRISDTRMSGISVQNLMLFKKLCGEAAWPNIIFLTTMWDEVDEETGVTRENDLREHYWKAMLHRKAHMCRFRGTFKAAWEILDSIIMHRVPRPLLLQTEMVTKGLPLQRTSAGKVLSMWIHDLINVVKKSLAQLEHLLRTSNNTDDSADKVQDSICVKEEQLEELSFQLIKLQAPPDDVIGLNSLPQGPYDARTTTSSSLLTTCSSTISSTSTTHSVSTISLSAEAIPSLTSIDGDLNVLRRRLQTAGSIAPFVNVSFEMILYIWDTVKRMGYTSEPLVLLVKDATYLVTAVVDQARAVGATIALCQVISALVADLSIVQSLLDERYIKNIAPKLFLQPTDEKTVNRCRRAITNAIETIHVKVVVRANDLRRIE